MTTIEKKSLRVGKYVDQNHVDSLVRTYKQERWKYNSERMNCDDSLNVYYTIDELQEFLQRSKDAGADGIKIHFGVYPENYTEKAGYAGKQTTVFVATKKVQTINGEVEKNVYIETEKGPRILAYNSGSLPIPLGRPTPAPLAGDGDNWGGIGTTLVDRADKGLVVV